MQVGYQVQATPFRTLLAVLVALAALLLTGALGYGLGQARGSGHAIMAPTQSVALPASQAVGQSLDDSSFRYGPAERASVLPGQAQENSSFPYGLADRAGTLSSAQAVGQSVTVATDPLEARADGQSSFPYGPADRASQP